MIWMLLAVLQQTPTLTESTSQPVKLASHTGISVSRTGRFLLLTQAERIVIRDPQSLEVIKELPSRWTAFGFNAADSVLLVVGEKVVRYDTHEWKEVDLGTLEDAKFEEEKTSDDKPDIPKPLKPQQAFVTAELESYYCSKSGDIAVAVIENGKLKSHLMGFNWDPALGPPRGILDYTESAFLIAFGGRKPGLVAQGTAYFFPQCHQVLGATTIGNTVVCVGRDSEAMYATRTWRTVAHREDLENSCVAFDRKSGWVFVGDKRGLRGWSPKSFDAPIRFPELKQAVTAVGVSSEKNALYSISEGILRRWAVSE